MEYALKRIERVDSFTKRLETEASRLKREIDKTNDRRKKQLARRLYATLVSKIKEIKKPTPLMYLRYE